MDKQKEEVRQKKNNLSNLKSQKMQYENMNHNIDQQIQELKDKRKQIKEKMDAYQEKLNKFRQYPNEFEGQWKGEVYNQMTDWFWQSYDGDYAWTVFYQISESVDAISRKITELENQKLDNLGILSNVAKNINTLTSEIKILLS